MNGSPAKNAVFAVMEYASMPLVLLCTTPTLLHRLGNEGYAIWVIASAGVTGGALISNGFGDAAIRELAAARADSASGNPTTVVRSVLTLNLFAACSVALLLCVLAPFISGRIADVSAAARHTCTRAIELGAVLVLPRTVETVFACALRAYEFYGTSTRITTTARVIGGLAACIAAMCGGGVLAVLAASGSVALLSCVFQAAAAQRHLGLASLLPGWCAAVVSRLMGFGCFSWLQTIAGIFTQSADRILLGALLGPAAVTVYSLSVQATTPVHGLAGAAAQVLFPYLGARSAGGIAPHRNMLRRIALANLAFAVGAATLATLSGRWFLSHWLHGDVPPHAYACLVLSAWSFALLALNVLPYWSLMALGRIRLLALTNLVAGAAVLFAISVLGPRFGVTGATAARLLLGPITWVTAIPLLKALRPHIAVLPPLENA